MCSPKPSASDGLLRSALAKIQVLFLGGSILALALLPAISRAQVEVGSDQASNYLNGSSNNWTNGANRGSGFQAWILTNQTTNSGFSGWFIGNPANAGINTNSTTGGLTDPSFGLYANPIDNNNTVTVKRALSSPLAIGQTLSFQWAVNWDSEGLGNKGFSLRAGGVNGAELVNVNQGWSASITMNGVNVFTNYGTNPMIWTFRRVNTNTLQVSTTPRDGSANNFITNLTASGVPDAFSFYATGLSTNNGDWRQPYFNDFKITGDRITLVGNFLSNPWSESDPNNVMTRGGDGNAFTLSNVYVLNPAVLRFKFVNGSFAAANWGLGTNPVVVNTNTGTATGVALREVPNGDPSIDIKIHRASGFYTFTFNTNTAAFSVQRRTFATLSAFVSAYGLVGNLAGGDKDPDGDGVTNGDEYSFNTDPTSGDTDGDGLSDANELTGGTNPLLEDTDGDGLRDDWEQTWGLNPLLADSDANGTADGLENPDGDLLTNLQEQQYRTDPLVNNPVPPLFSSVVLTGLSFNQNTSLNWQNQLRRSGTNANLWSGLVYIHDTNLAATNRFKFLTSQGTDQAEWGRGPLANLAYKEAFQPLQTTLLSSSNYFRFQIDVSSGEFSVSAMGSTDTNSNGLPDAYEQWYGARLAGAPSVLNPGSDYDGDGLTVTQEFAAGSNPVEDVEAPTISLIGDEILLVTTNVSTFTDLGITVTDNSSNRVSTNLWVTVTTNRSRVDQLVSTKTPGWDTVTYTATDAAGNATTNTSRKVVIGNWNASYPSLHYYNLQSIVWPNRQGGGRVFTNSQVSPLDVYAQYYRVNKTPGTNRDTSVRCWIGLSTNTNHPASWEVADWKEADFNAGSTGANDEYKATYSNLPTGTYRVVSRWQFGSETNQYAYGGVNDFGDGNGGALGATTGSGADLKTYQPYSLTVLPTAVTFANIQFPTAPTPLAPGSISGTNSFEVYIKFFAQGVTEPAGAPTLAGVKAQLGYGLAGGDPAINGAYTWVDAIYNTQSGNDDEYLGKIPAEALVAVGKVHYAARFSLDNGVTWVYGGINNVWDAVNSPSAVLSVGTTPKDILLSSSVLAETTAPNVLVGGLSTTDDDAGDQFTYTLVTGLGSTDNTFFNISGANLRATTGLDYETKPTYSVRVRSTDKAGLSFEKAFTITVTDVAEGTTFAGWAGGGATNSELVGKYAIGGATNSSAASEAPVSAVDSTTLSLSAIVRTNDTKLKVEGEAGGSLTNWSTNGVSMTPSSNTNGVPDGHQRQVFSVDRANSPNRQFLRLKATLQP